MVVRSHRGHFLLVITMPRIKLLTVARHEFPATWFDVIDGDTVKVILDRGYGDKLKMSCRIANEDTPERRTQAGKLVTEAVIGWFDSIDTEHLRCKSYKRDKYAGRFVGDFHPESDPSDSLSKWLISTRMARKYGGGKKRPWTKVALERASADALKWIEKFSVYQIGG